MDWSLFDGDHHHERVNLFYKENIEGMWRVCLRFNIIQSRFENINI